MSTFVRDLAKGHKYNFEAFSSKSKLPYWQNKGGSKTHANSNFVSEHTSHTCTDEISNIGASYIANVVCSEIWKWAEEEFNTLAASSVVVMVVSNCNWL